MDKASDFYGKVIKDPFGCPVDMVRELVRRLPDEEFRYVYHGQLTEWPLQTTLERDCLKAGVSYEEMPSRECQMIRHFKRWYRGDDQEAVWNDTLYCMSLMQHHGAPTRLLDWTYSPLVAIYFALEYAQDNCIIENNTCWYPSIAVWRLDQKWCKEKAKDIVGEYIIHLRNVDRTRGDSTFLPLYMSDKPQRFVFMENPLLLHQRLHLQQGVFLCPGDVTVPFARNISEGFKDWDNVENVVKMTCEIRNKNQLDEAFGLLSRMNINRETLFPGLDGFAKSMWYRQSLYRGLANERRGLD